MYETHSLGTGFLLALTLLSFSAPTNAAFVVSSWRLTTGVQDSSGSSIVQDVEDLEVVQNPLNATSQAAVGPNTAQTAYDFSWSGDTGSFHIAPTQHVETLEVVTVSTGFILLSSDIDLIMSVAGSLDYTSPPGDLDVVDFEFSVRDPSIPLGTIFDADLEGGNLVLEPASGTLAFEDEFVLPGGITWRIDYRARAHNLAEPNPSGPIDTNGFIHFDLAPVPETSTLSLLALAALLTLRRRVR